MLVALRDAIRRREVWVAGAGRWRTPKSDLPTDFEANRAAHYAAIRAPLDSCAFIAELKARLDESLAGLSTSLANDAAGGVRDVTRAAQAWITVPRPVAQDEPRRLGALKDEVGRRWGTVGPLDVFKETDLLTGFTDEFSSVATREIVPRDILRRRLLLALFALGTSMGIPRRARHDLLARRAQEHLRLQPAALLLGQRGRSDDRGAPAPLH